MRSIKLLISLLLWGGLYGYPQNTIGLPEIINYSKHQYNGGTQNWDIQQDARGILYFANNEGMLTFDGTRWALYPLSNKTNVRSLAIGSDNRIYAGGQDEIGYFSPDARGRLTYTSLQKLVPEKERSFADVWDIVPLGKDVFFRTNRKILHLSNNVITVYTAPTEWAYMGVHNHRLVAQDINTGLLQFNHDVWEPYLPAANMPGGLYISTVVPLGNDSSLVTSLKNGLFILSGQHLTPLVSKDLAAIDNELIYGALVINPGWIAVATSLGGCYIINRKGELVQRLSRKEGLQNNNITSIFRDRDNNLWLGLDNGIDFVAYDNAIKHIYPENLNEGSGYAALIYHRRLYLGTTNGLYKVPLTGSDDLSFVKGQFETVPGTKGQVWGLAAINDDLLLGHHEGAFQVTEKGAVPITHRYGWGYWQFLPFQNVYPAASILAGNYHGLEVFNYKEHAFHSAGIIPGFGESARFTLFDADGTIWTSHPYRGVYKITSPGTGQSITLYNEKNGLPSFMNNHVYKVKNRVVVATEKGIYQYNAQTNRFALSPDFEKIFHQTSVRYLKEDPQGNIWFIHNKDLGIVDYSGTVPQLMYVPELNGKMVSGFEHIYPVDEQNIFIGAEKGFYHINYLHYKKNRPVLLAYISTVLASGKSDSLVFGGYAGEVNELKEQAKPFMPAIPNAWNSLHFEYSATLYGHDNNLLYSYYLKGLDKGWSDWSKKTEKDYTNLSPGSYTFQVKARNNLGNESVISSYTFFVAPPWYKTWWAYCIYLLLLAALAWWGYKQQQKKFALQQQRHEEEQKRLQYLHQLEMEKSEKEIVKLRNERLVTEIDHKNKELASAAMHLVQKGELLTKVKGELMRLKKTPEKEGGGEELKKIVRILSEEDKMDENWEQFSVHFDRLHSDFLTTLKEQHPALTANELKLCAYLRLNLSTKEIAQLMNISVRGVEISRYRLRKKLQLSTETNLFQFLLNIKQEKTTG